MPTTSPPRYTLLGRCDAVALLETAGRFFATRGYEAVDRAGVSGAIRATAEFSTLCPDSKAVWHKVLNPAP